MKIPYRSALLVTAFLLMRAGESSAQEGRIFPLRGVVANGPLKPSLAVRKNPPELTAFSYRLGDPLCSAVNGSEFVALEELYLANGEVWFKVSFTKGNCARSDLSGWMIARFKDNRWGVSILKQGIVLSSQQAASPSRIKSNGPSVEEGTSLKPLWDLLFLLIGTGLAVCIVSIERSQDVHFKQLRSRFVAFRFVTLSGINTLIAFLLMDQLFQAPEPNLLFRLFQIVQGSKGGFALLGFLLSVVLIKFMSFAEPS